MAQRRLGIGFIGSGFITRFHIRSFVSVRDADVLGVWSPNRGRAEEAAKLARDLGVGEARTFSSIAEMAKDPGIDALWLCGPNHLRLDNMSEIAEAVAGGAKLVGIACEKPLGRNAREARRMLELVREAKLLDGYLENQVFSPAVVRGRELVWARGARAAGRPYLARAAEEHSGPHAAWFWRGDLQGGGVLNDMMCHSVETARYLLTEPGKPRNSLTPTRVSAQIACLKWQRPHYARQLQERYGEEVDYARKPSEDFARALVEYRDEEGTPLIVEATTSWSYVGAGLRLSMELLGPEYSMRVNTLDTELELFFSRELAQGTGEDLVEKQNAETGVMPVVSDESFAYGYDAENRHMVECFLRGERPRETFEDGVAVSELLMTAYQSAEEGRTIEFPPPGLEQFVPAVARGTWNPAAGRA
ncbi:MAG TPA: Gfo/Idh/MocA family oxidoreductase [Thermoanaerobaculia bacterium]|nr:Gfo/Idh/MocA family oxidoreductase [Thermoanaerobaculia bacterium]